MAETEVFEMALKMLKDKTDGTEINASSVIKIMSTAMEVVEATKVKGKEQKDLAVKLVRQVIVDAPITDDKEKLLLDFYNMLGCLRRHHVTRAVVARRRGRKSVRTAEESFQQFCRGGSGGHHPMPRRVVSWET